MRWIRPELIIVLGGLLWYFSFRRRKTAPQVPGKSEPEEVPQLEAPHEFIPMDEGAIVPPKPGVRYLRSPASALLPRVRSSALSLSDEDPMAKPTFARSCSGWTDGQDDGQDVLSLMCRTSIIREPASVARERPPIQEPFSHEPEFHEVIIRFKNQTFNAEDTVVAKKLREMLTLRQRFTHSYELDGKQPIIRVEMRQGVMRLLNDQGVDQLPMIPPLTDFAAHVEELWTFAKDGPARTTCSRRLALLTQMGELHAIINKENEAKGTLNNSQDFYQIPKVDNHIHASAMMGARHLLQFIVDKLDYEPDTVVLEREGKSFTLAEVFAEKGLNRDNLSIDDLKVQGCGNMFHRFDRFNNSYNPFGDTVLRDIFLKTNNLIHGRYFAQLCSQVVDYLEVCDNNVYIEPRLSIYGQSKGEWIALAQWFLANRLHRKYVMWMIQLPRVFHVFRSRGKLQSFQEYLENVFSPLFAATIEPLAHPEIAELLSCLVGMDSVDDESVEDHLFPGEVTPDAYVSAKNPTYSYYLFYTWANLQSLNALRKLKGMNLISFRPHCGEAGPVHHLATTFLLAQSINHGIRLSENYTLQYLYYLAEVGMSISPLSNNVLFVELKQNPFPVFFRQGLNVTLSTDDPLQFHTTREALVEEYTIAKQLWRLSSTDMSEIARNSVMQSGMTHDMKLHLLGPKYDQTDNFNDPKYTNIPECRFRHRRACKVNEYKFVWLASGESEVERRHWHELCYKLAA